MRRRVAIAREPAVGVVEFDDLDGAAFPVARRRVGGHARMHEIKQERPVAAQDDLGMVAAVLVVFPGAGLVEQARRLALPSKSVVRAVGAETDVPEQVNQQPVMPVPEKCQRRLAAVPRQVG